MPIRRLFDSGSAVASLPVPVKESWPLVGFISSAAMRSRVVFPAPLWPSRATNSPGRISSETARRAISEPKRFSTLLKRMPHCRMDAGAGIVAGRGQGGSLAFYQIAEVLLDAGVFALVIFFADGAGLAAQFEAEEGVL